MNYLNEFSVSSFDSLSHHLPELIFSNGDLKIESEDFLYELISSRISRDIGSVSLLEFIQFEFLLPITVSRFCASSHEWFGDLTI
jgi:hypothetical protein